MLALEKTSLAREKKIDWSRGLGVNQAGPLFTPHSKRQRRLYSQGATGLVIVKKQVKSIFIPVLAAVIERTATRQFLSCWN